MDVRCEKCQTEYELDEQRLKPGGVTVKCTNCGHMFKIRKRTPTNVGAPASFDRPKTASGRTADRIDSGLDDAPTRALMPEDGPTTIERQWIIRLENGEQKSCRELATLQQWIVGQIVTRESLISRTGKTWKRLGDIAELAQYFDVADEAQTTRDERPTRPPKPVAGTMLGFGAPPSAAGGTILPDDELEGRATGNYRSHPGGTGRPPTQPPPVPGSTKTPPMGSNVGADPVAAAPRRPITTPPPPPARRTPTGPAPVVTARPATTPPVPRAAPPPDSRSTAAWASDPVKATGVAPSGPFVGKLAAIPDEPAFAGRVRVGPSDEGSFDTGRVRIDDDDELLPARSGSRAGLVILLMMLVVGAGAAAAVYVFVIKKDEQVATTPAADAGLAAELDASLVVTPMIDAAEAPVSPIEIARGELAADHEARLRAALESLPRDDPEAQAVRANLGAAIAQALGDRAGVVAEKAEADKLRKEAKTIVLEAATAAQRAHKAAPDAAAANLAMANVLRLQGKPAKDLKRYADTAQAKATPEWAADVALAAALVLARDGKLDAARAALEALDQGDRKLETSGDVRPRFHLALIALAQNRTADAKALVDQVLAAQPEHAAARALATRIETRVASTDPLPPEDPRDPKDTGATKPNPTPTVDTSGGGSYDQLLARANALAEKNCSKAIDLYAKALEQKPNGVEALTGMGYCHIDAKQFASAFSKFRAALAVSSRYEPALWGVGEAYQQQGRREQALESYKRYLEVYPDSAKAKKQIERLGGGSPPADGADPTPPPTPPAPTPDPPTPTPLPPEGGGTTE